LGGRDFNLIYFEETFVDKLQFIGLFSLILIIV